MEQLQDVFAEDYTQIEEALLTAGQRMVREGQLEGLQKGLVQGQRQLLLRLMGVKFGELPKYVVEMIEQAGPDQLDIWGERLVLAQTLAEVVPLA